MKILNFGSLNLDYVYSVDRFVRPGETLSSRGLEIFCGGKGLNQSVAAARAGATVYHAGAVGNDGGRLLEMLQSAGVNTEFVRIKDGPGGHAIIQVDSNGQNCILLYGGANRAITESDADVVLSRFQRGDLLLLQNEINNLPYIMEKAFEMGLRIALNPSPMDETIHKLPLHTVEWFLLNEIEAAELGGGTEPLETAKALHRRFPRSKIVLTLGKRGVLYYDGEKVLTHGIYDVKPVDTTAAGDTFTGFFLASVAAGLEPETALERASVASSISVSRPGAAGSIPTLAEVLNHNLKPKA